MGGNGEIESGIDSVEVDTNFGNHSIQGDQPRTAVGIIAPDHLVFVVVDPEALTWFGGPPVQLSRQAVYTLSFFIFWAVIAAASRAGR